MFLMAFWALLCLYLAHELRSLPATPRWWQLSYGGLSLSSELALEVHVEQEGVLVPCLMKGVMECGDIKANWDSRIFELSHGRVLRWSWRFDSPPKLLQLSAWLPAAAVEGHVDGSPVTSRRRPAIGPLDASCEASSSYVGRGCERLLDGDHETEWFAGKGQQTAWVVLDLGADREIREVSWSFWAKSADWILESRPDGGSWTQRDAQQGMNDFNGRVELKGWKAASRWLRLSLRNGHLDPWNFGVYFGLRSFVVIGHDETSQGAGAAWGVKQGPGLWLALEHPRSRCHVEPSGSRKTICSLSLTERSFEVTASLGAFEDGEHSQLRRSFREYLEEARGRPFGQNLHYNSWYDLRSSACPYCHEMNEASCMQRLEAFNGNLSRYGHTLDGFLLDDGWDNSDSLWEIDSRRFPRQFAGLVRSAKPWGTRLGLWMSPFGGYGEAGQHRVRFGASRGYERSPRGGFALAGPTPGLSKLLSSS